MNLKLNNENARSTKAPPLKKQMSSVKEERRRTGRYIAILVGICLLLLAIYHAWVRRIPVVASLVVPALIMFIYVGWVLYTASRDKLKMLDAEAAMQAALHELAENDVQISETSVNNNDASVLSSKDSTKLNSPVDKDWSGNTTVLVKEERKIKDGDNRFVTPIILVNDRPPDDFDEIWTRIVETVANDKMKPFNNRRRFKRRFCRSKKQAVFKRSYSIA